MVIATRHKDNLRHHAKYTSNLAGLPPVQGVVWMTRGCRYEHNVIVSALGMLLSHLALGVHEVHRAGYNLDIVRVTRIGDGHVGVKRKSICKVVLK